VALELEADVDLPRAPRDKDTPDATSPTTASPQATLAYDKCEKLCFQSGAVTSPRKDTERPRVAPGDLELEEGELPSGLVLLGRKSGLVLGDMLVDVAACVIDRYGALVRVDIQERCNACTKGSS